MSSVNLRNQVFICVGSGGVGKTTVASVLGLHFALAGHKTMVITVDPAQRLLDALSLDKRWPKPKKIDVAALTDRKCAEGGELYAFMPDLKKEWMDFLNASIGRSDRRREIATNHFYQYMADGLPGAFEIICSHVLFRIMKSGDYDTIILDTPPSSQSVSFFDVPKKISAVLEQSIFRSLMNKRHSVLLKITKKLFFFSGGLLEKTLERVIGSHFLSELIDFALTIDALYEPMLERTKAMESLLKASDTKYVLVSRPSSASINDCFHLKESLSKRGINIHQIIVNQVMPEFDQKELRRERQALKKELDCLDTVDAVEHVLSLYEDELALEKKLISRVKSSFLTADVRSLFLGDIQSKKPGFIAELLRHYEQRVS